MAIWIVLLIGCVAFGALVVGALVLPRTLAPFALLLGLTALITAVSAFGQIAQRYQSPEAIISALVILLAAIGAGFAVATGSLPHLAAAPRLAALPDPVSHGNESYGVVLMSCTEPDRYNPVAVAQRQNLLAESAEIDVPATALPFLFFAEKARYRAVGGSSPGAAPARRVTRAVADRMAPDVADVRLAWCHTPASLTSAVASLAKAGAARIAIVVLGPSESGPLDAAHAPLDRALRERPGLDVVFGSPVWTDRLLPARLAERILASSSGADLADLGVVLVDPGLPPVWERRYTGAQNVENYFDQRVRILLCEAGVAEHHVRVAWLEWQTPDVTEAVRHLAALGCRRIVVAASTIALPTLDTALDLGHAITFARVPTGVQVVTVSPWGDDEGFTEAVCRSAADALGIEFPSPLTP